MTVSSRRIRATVDTNLFVSAAIRADGIPAQILAAWQRDAFVLVTSAELDAEVHDVYRRADLLRRFRVPAAQRAVLITGLSVAEHVLPLYPLPIGVRDPKDDPLLAYAIGGQVDYLVTGDKDLHDLAGLPAIGELRIIAPRDFLIRLGISLDEQ